MFSFHDEITVTPVRSREFKVQIDPQSISVVLGTRSTWTFYLYFQYSRETVDFKYSLDFSFAPHSFGSKVPENNRPDSVF